MGGQYHVFVVNSDGTGQMDLALLLGGYSDANPEWSPTANRLAYRRQLSGGDGEVMTVNADGSSPTIIGTNPGLTDDYPRWSPNGQRIAWQSQRVAAGPYQLMVANADGSNPRQLTFLSNGDVYKNFRWSPDSRLIAYAADPGTQTDLFAVEVATGQITQLTNAVVHGQARDDFSWEPNSDRIVYVANATPGETGTTDRELWVVYANGSGRQRLTYNTTWDLTPRWSPAGDKIAFGGEPAAGNREIMTISPTGGTPPNVSMMLGNDADPCWRIDGQWLAWEGRDAGGQGEIYMAWPDGSSRQNLSSSSADDRDPLWSPNGAEVAFTSDRFSPYQLFGAETGGPTAVEFVLEALHSRLLPRNVRRISWQGRWVLPAAGLAVSQRSARGEQWNRVAWQAGEGEMGGRVSGSVRVAREERAEYRLELHLLDGSVVPLGSISQ